MITIGIDPSLRSSALVTLNSNTGELLDFIVIQNNRKDIKTENLILSNVTSMMDFIENCYNDYGAIDKVLLENLSLNSKSLAMDQLSAQTWYIRLKLLELKYEYGTIAPMSWKAKLFTQDEKKFLSDLKKTDKKQYRVQLKEIAMKHVDDISLSKFDTYIADNKYKKTTIYDLTDAYCIAKHAVFNLMQRNNNDSE